MSSAADLSAARIKALKTKVREVVSRGTGALPGAAMIPETTAVAVARKMRKEKTPEADGRPEVRSRNVEKIAEELSRQCETGLELRPLRESLYRERYLRQPAEG